MEPSPQGKIGRYVIQGELGRGAMGVVYRALDPAIGRTVAVKTIRIGQFNDEREIKQVQDRMMREAQAAGILSHPNIVTIYDIQHENDTAFIFMEYVDGDTFEKLLHSDTAIDGLVILRLLKQAAEALDYAHQRGIIHRDVKPANIMVRRDGVAKIADFGIARMQSHSLTQTGQILGTPNYMSPEQISGKPVDGRADQYSLAVMLYEVLTGERPFVADSLPTLLFRVVSEAPQPAPHFNPTLSPAIDAVLQRALAKAPADRFPSCSEMMHALESACENTPGWTTLVCGGGHSQLTLTLPKAQAAPKVVVLPQQETIDARPVAPVAARPAAPAPVPVARRAPAPVAQPARKPVKKFNMTAIAAVAVAAALVGMIGIGVKLIYDKRQATATFPTASAPVSVPGTSVPTPAEVKKADPPSTVAVAKPDTRTAEPPATRPSAPPPVTATPGAVAGAGARAVAIRTIPEGANVVIDDGKFSSCTSPCLVELPNGRHSATVMLESYKAEIRIFYIPHDAAIDVKLERRKGMLEVASTPPGATVTIDGAAQPQKTPARFPLVVGKHTVVVTLPGKPAYTQSFDMRSEATISLQPNFAN